MRPDRLALRATTHCLTGCVIGEVAGMTIDMASGLSNGVTVTLAIALAFVFGYGLTMRPLLAAGTCPSPPPRGRRSPATPSRS